MNWISTVSKFSKWKLLLLSKAGFVTTLNQWYLIFREGIWIHALTKPQKGRYILFTKGTYDNKNERHIFDNQVFLSLSCMIFI